MSSVDNRIVKMTFDNQQFESGVKTTLDSINNLKSATDFNGIEKGVQSLQKRFSTMGIVGMEVTRRITNAAIDSAKKLADMTLGQVKQGGMTRALNIEQARFQLQGLFTDMKGGAKAADAKVERVMKSALNSVKGTAYGLDEAAKAASVLAASGVGMNKMEPVLTSIAGAAAMTGRSFEDIGNIYSTVASNGQLMTMQLRQFSAAGLNVSAVLAKYYHKSENEINDMVHKGKVSFDDFSEAMLKFGKQAKRANETFSGSLANMKAALSRIGAMFASPYLVNARDVFNSITPAIDEVSDALKPFASEVEKDMKSVKNALVGFFNFLSGDTEKNIGPLHDLVNGLINIFQGLRHSIIPGFQAAFKELFPKATLQNLGKVLEGFKTFSEYIKIKLLSQTINFKDGFAGLFTIIKAVGNVLGFLKKAVDAVTKPFGGLIGIVGGIIGMFGRAIQRLYAFVSGSELLRSAANNVITFLGKASQAIHDFVTSSKFLQVTNDIIHGVGEALSFFGRVVSGLFESIKDSSIFEKISNGVAKLKDSIKGFFSGKDFNFESIFSGFTKLFNFITGGFDKVINFLAHVDFGKLINTGIGVAVATAIADIAASIKFLSDKLTHDGKNIVKSMKELPIVIKDVGYNLKYALKAKQIQEQAKALLVFAGAVLVLTFAVKNLASLNTGDLIKALAGMAVLFKLLDSELTKMQDSLKNKMNKGLLKVAASLVIFAMAIKSLAKTVKMLGELDIKDLAKGLVSIAFLMTSLDLFINKMNHVKLEKAFNAGTGMGLMGLAIALNIMASAVKKLGGIPIKELGKGIASLAVILAAVTAMTRFVGDPSHMISMGAGILVMSTSMLIFAKAVNMLGSIETGSLVKGLWSLATILLTLSAVVNSMSGSTALAVGASLIGMSLGVLAISAALKVLSTVTGEGLAKGVLSIIAILATLGILAYSVKPTSLIAASAAIVIFAAGIALLTPALLAFSQLSLDGILKALIMLAGVLLTFGVAATALTGAIIPMILLGVAIGVLGAGVLVTAAGLMLLAAAFTALAAAGTAGAAVLVAAFTQIVEGIVTMVPTIATALAEAIITFITTIASHTSELVDAAVKLGTALLDGLTQLIPKLVSTGMQLILSLLSGIAQNIGQIAAMAVRIIVEFIQGIASMIGPLIQAGINLMLSFILGLANGIRDNSELFFAALGSLLEAMLEMVLTAIEKLASHIPVIGKKIEKGLKGAKKELRETFDVEDTNKEFKKKMEDNQKAVEELAPNFKIAGQKNKDALKEGTNGLSNEMAGVGKDGIVAMLDAFKAGEIDLKDAGISLDAATMEGLKSGDLSSADVANTLMKGYSDSIAAGGENAKNNAKGVNDGTVNEFSKGDDKVKKSGEEKVKAYAAGISPKDVLTNVKEIMAAAARAFSDKTAVGAVQASGTKTVENYASGINKGKSKATTAGKSTANNAKTGMESVKFDSAGLAACSGFLAGLNNASYAARITARGTALGNMAYNAAKNAIKAHSPSKKFEQLGIWADQGLINGLKSLQGRVYNTSYAIGENSVDALSDSMTKVYEILNSDLDMNPTITPVLDLSNVQNGIDSMNGMLDTRTMSASISGNMRGIGLQPAFAAATGDNVTNNNTNTFNITVDGAESPEAFADRLVEAIHMRQRMS